MANNFAERIEELEGDRRKYLRQAKRARGRRRDYLRAREWDKARQARRVATKANREARIALANIRKLRKARSAANRLARVLRHRRRAIGQANDVVWFDGKMCRKAVVPHMLYARKRRWRGVLVSGYRSPAYSRSLCFAMCGAARCSGRCAGDASNHVRIAIDVSDYFTFGNEMHSCPYEPRIYNALPHDRVHYSPSGN